MEEQPETNRINFIPCVKWVCRGVSNPNPDKIQLTKDELVEIITEAKNSANENNEDEDESMETENPASNDEFNLESYDQEDDNVASALGISSLAELPTEAEDNFEESDDSDREDDIIKHSDNLILVGHVEGQDSILEVYVYNEEEESLYVHHDIILPAFPLCLEWLNYEANSPKGNYCAIGSMLSTITVWDLDLINSIEPAYKLGKPGSKKKKREHVGHSDAVLALAWNKHYDHILASGSVDQTIILWDLETQTPSTTVKQFNDKVQCLEWHLFEPQTLLAGACDNQVKIFDCRTPKKHLTWEIEGEAERLAWNPHRPNMFMAGTSTGALQGFDCRKGQLWSISAHEKEVTGLTISSICPGLVVTGSPDGTIKTWDAFQAKEAPILVGEKDFSLGTVQCVEFSPNSPFVITAGGDNKQKNFLVYDLQNLDSVRHKFGSRKLESVNAEENIES